MGMMVVSSMIVTLNFYLVMIIINDGANASGWSSKKPASRYSISGHYLHNKIGRIDTNSKLIAHCAIDTVVKVLLCHQINFSLMTTVIFYYC